MYSTHGTRVDPLQYFCPLPCPLVIDGFDSAPLMASVAFSQGGGRHLPCPLVIDGFDSAPPPNGISGIFSRGRETSVGKNSISRGFNSGIVPIVMDKKRSPYYYHVETSSFLRCTPAPRSKPTILKVDQGSHFSMLPKIIKYFMPSRDLFVQSLDMSCQANMAH